MNNRCFALNKNNYCQVLSIVKCPCSSCSFFKTPEQAAESRRKANDRLASLDQVYQKHIADTYYHGRIPWLEGGASYDG